MGPLYTSLLKKLVVRETTLGSNIGVKVAARQAARRVVVDVAVFECYRTRQRLFVGGGGWEGEVSAAIVWFPTRHLQPPI